METAAASVIAELINWSAQATSNTLIPWNFIGSLEGFDGFGVSTGSALTLIFINSTSGPAWSWPVCIYSGFATDVPSVTESLLWVNSQNRNNSFGKYHVAVKSDDNTANPLCDYSIPGKYFEAALVGNSELTNYLRGVFVSSFVWAQEDSSSVLTELGGNPYLPNEEGLMTLFHVGSSG